MFIGARTHDYGKHAIEALPVLLQREGFAAAQLVLPKAFASIESYADVSIDALESIKRHFAQAGIKIHIL
ncbi:MAG: hypothetical protein LBV04_06770, partial [Deferribacteraceae bacterium]|nr:hypothetical protein [Deferribacteraceae bacterium]